MYCTLCRIKYKSCQREENSKSKTNGKGKGKGRNLFWIFERLVSAVENLIADLGSKLSIIYLLSKRSSFHQNRKCQMEILLMRECELHLIQSRSLAGSVLKEKQALSQCEDCCKYITNPNSTTLNKLSPSAGNIYILNVTW